MDKYQLIDLQWDEGSVFSNESIVLFTLNGVPYRALRRSHGKFDVRLLSGCGELVVATPANEQYIPVNAGFIDLEPLEIVLLFGSSYVEYKALGIIPYDGVSTAEELAALAVAIYRTQWSTL